MTFLLGGVLGYMSASSVEAIVSKLKKESNDLKKLDSVNNKLKYQEQKLENGINSFSLKDISKDNLERIVVEVTIDTEKIIKNNKSFDI